MANEKNEKLEIKDVSVSEFTEQYNLILRIYYTLAFLYQSEEANSCLLKKGSYEAMEQVVNLFKAYFHQDFQKKLHEKLSMCITK